MWRSFRRAAKVLTWVLLSLLVATVAGVVALLLWARSTSGQRRILAAVVPRAQKSLTGKLTVGRLSGDLTRGLVLDDVRIYDREGQLAIAVRQLRAKYDLLALAHHALRFRSVDVDGAFVHARYLRDGKLNLTELTRPSQNPTPEERPLRIVVEQLTAEARLRFDGKRDQLPAPLVAQLHLQGSADVRGSDIDAQLATATVASESPMPAILELRGGVHDGGDGPELRGVTASLRTDGRAIDRLLPGAGLQGPFEARLNADGRESGLRASLVVTPARGELRVDGTAHLDGHGRLVWQAELRGRRLDPAAIRRAAPPGDVELAANAHGENARGVVELARLEAAIAGTHAHADGRLELDRGLRAANLRAELHSPDLSRLATLGVPAIGGQLDAHAHLVKASSVLRVDADVSARRLQVAAARVRAIDARVSTNDLQGRAMVNVRGVELPGGAHDGGPIRLRSVELAASGDRHQVALTVDALGSKGAIAQLRAHGVPLPKEGPWAVDVSIDHLLFGMRGQRWQTTEPGHLRVDAKTALATLSLGSNGQRLRVDGRVGLDRDAIDVTVDGKQLDVQRLAALAQPRLDVPATRLDVHVALAGTRAEPIVTAHLDGRTLAWPSRELPPVTVQLDGRYQQGRVRGQLALADASERLRATVDAPVELAGKRPLSAQLAVTHLQLARMRPYLPAKLRQLDGAADLTLALSGTVVEPELVTHLELPDFALYQLRHSRVAVDASYRRARLDGRVAAQLKAEGRSVGALAVTLHAPIDLSRNLRPGRSQSLVEELQHTVPVTLSAQLQAIDLQRLPLGELGVTTPVERGIVDGSIELKGTLHRPELKLQLNGHRLAVAGLDDLDVKLDSEYANVQARATVDATLHGGAILSARAESGLDVQKLLDHQDWQAAPIVVDATVPAYDLSRLPKLGGTLSGSAHLRGTLAHPTGTAALEASALRLNQLRFRRVSARGGFDGAVATATVDARELGTGTLSLDARVPIAAHQPIAGRLQAHAFSLALADVGPIRQLDGTLEAALTLAGTRAAPQLDGKLALEKGALGIGADPRLYRDLTVELHAHDDTIELDRLAVKVGSGSLKAHGSIGLAGMQLSNVSLFAEADKFPFQQGNVGAWIDAHAELHGKEVNHTLQGTLTITQGSARLPKLTTGRSLQSTGPLADVVFTDEEALRERRAKAKAKQADQTPEANVIAHIPGPFKVRSPELATDLKGNLDVKLVGGVPKLYGSAETTWGHLEVLGRRYQIERARVGFDGQVEPDPTLDVRLTREITDTTIVIEVHGTAKKPDLQLSSDPPIYDKSQIIGIIVSGDPGNQKIDNRTTDQKVVGAISGLLVNKIKDQIGPGLPIDVIKVNTGSDNQSFGGFATTRVEVGKYITDNVYVSYVHQFGTPTTIPSQRPNSNEADVEYRFKRRYSLNLRYGDAGVGGLDVFWTLRY